MIRSRLPQRPVVLDPEEPIAFPSPLWVDDEGLVAIGGDLSVERLCAAYRAGIFPWYNDGYPVLWWSPNPRAILRLENLHVSRSLKRKLSRSEFTITWNLAFDDVLVACGEKREDGTWIIPEMRDAFNELHQAGHAHSLEVWQGNRLVGGLYGVQSGGLFAAESMFHRVTDASKIAVVAAVRSLAAQGITVFDVQFITDHLRSLGVTEVTRRQYLDQIDTACQLRPNLVGLMPSTEEVSTAVPSTGPPKL